MRAFIQGYRNISGMFKTKELVTKNKWYKDIAVVQHRFVLSVNVYFNINKTAELAVGYSRAGHTESGGGRRIALQERNCIEREKNGKGPAFNCRNG